MDPKKLQSFLRRLRGTDWIIYHDTGWIREVGSDRCPVEYALSLRAHSGLDAEDLPPEVVRPRWLTRELQRLVVLAADNEPGHDVVMRAHLLGLVAEMVAAKARRG